MEGYSHFASYVAPNIANRFCYDLNLSDKFISTWNITFFNATELINL